MQRDGRLVPGARTDLAGRPRGRAIRDAELDDAEARGSQRSSLRDRLSGERSEVYLVCADHRIGREIAMKVIRRAQSRPANPDCYGEVLREARVQGQLEHPSITSPSTTTSGSDASG